jgi:DNA helicase-2/ATP-dependent DNA helicase PcrA
LLLVGLSPAIEGYNKKDQHFNIPNIALGWSRDENYIGFKEIYLI